MSAEWEEKFRRWSGPASASEDEKRDGTERAIREAIQTVPGLSDRVSRIFAKGSYRNNTNVRLDSDVDVAVEYSGYAQFELTEQVAGWDPQDAGVDVVYSDYSPGQFKTEIEDALIGRFGASAVERGNKALHVREASRSLAADVVPCFEFHLFYAPGKYLKGTQIWPDSGPVVQNWPDQHCEQGVEKNNATGRRFKAMVRALKRLENQMVEEGFAKEVPSYLIECLVYNVPNVGFSGDSYYQNMRYVLTHTFNGTLNDTRCADWVEVNGIKYLFHPSQKWNRVEAHNFLSDAWDYVGFA